MSILFRCFIVLFIYKRSGAIVYVFPCKCVVKTSIDSGQDNNYNDKKEDNKM